MTERQYARLVSEMAPKSPIWKDCLWAFTVGGLICTLGQLFINAYTALGLEKTDASTAASMSLVFLSALLTGLSLYDNIAKHAGAGTLVPSPALPTPSPLPLWNSKPRALSSAWARRCSPLQGRSLFMA